MDFDTDTREHLARRSFLGSAGIATAALHGLLAAECGIANEKAVEATRSAHNCPRRAKNVIYLFQSGAPSQIDLFDYKPQLGHRFDEDLPNSIRMGQRLTTMTSGQERFPIAPAIFQFQQYGQTGTWISELMPHMANVVDDVCIVKSMYTEAINHDPAITFIQTGAQQPGRPSLGSWLAYGLGSENANLPAFVAMISRGSGRPNCQPLYDRLWGAGFLPSQYQGVKFQSTGDPVLFLSNPNGVSRQARRRLLDDLAKLNQMNYDQFGDPEITARIRQYELAFRMQAAVPELADIGDEPKHVLDLYGPDVLAKGSYASNCLLARRLVERGVRFVQLFHMGWDQHNRLPKQIRGQCRDTDQASAALLRDLKQRGLLEDTLVVWGGEFGRTVYSQGELTTTNYGRDHHPRCFTIWLAGAGIRPGLSYGETDEYSYNITSNPVHIHDLNATLLYLLGIDHERLTYRFQGRDFRLTDVHGKVVHDIIV